MQTTSNIAGHQSLCQVSDYLIAYERVQSRLLNSPSYSVTERYERSLNEILNHPERQGEPNRLANAAYGNAGKVVRARMARSISYDETCHELEAPNTQTESSIIDWSSFLDGAWPMGRERTICQLLLQGKEITQIATEVGISVGNANVLVSRIRKKNREHAIEMAILST